MSHNASIRSLVVLIPMLTASMAAQAEQDIFNELSLEDFLNIKIEAGTKSSTSISKSPSSASVIPYQQIKKSGAKTVPELLRRVAGVNVRWNPMMQTIDIRGFGQSPFSGRVLILIDGIPFNSWNKGGFPQQPGFDFFPLENVSQIEVIRGPSSSVYGENAYWGVINIKSLSGSDLDNDGKNGQVAVYGGDLSTRTVSGLYGKEFSEDSSLLVSAKIQNSILPLDFYEDQGSDFNAQDFFIKYIKGDWTFSYYRHDDKMDGFAAPLGPAGYVFKSVDEISQSVNILSTQYDAKFDDDKLRISADIGYAQRDGSHCAACHASNIGTNDPDFAAINFDSAQEYDHGYQVVGDVLAEMNYWENNSVLVGLELRRSDSGDSIAEPQGDTIDQVRSYTKAALYVQDQLTLLDDSLIITAGARFDSETNPDLFDDQISPRISAVFSPREELSFRAGWNQAFHFPAYANLYQNVYQKVYVDSDDPASNPILVPFWFNPNPELKEERIENIDFGMTYLINQNLLAKVDLYHTTVKDFIVSTSVNGTDNGTGRGTTTLYNHPDDATVTGIETELKWTTSSSLEGYVNLAYQRNSQKGSVSDFSNAPLGIEDFQFEYSPKTKANIGVSASPYKGLTVSTDLSWKSSTEVPKSRQPASPFRLGSSTQMNVHFAYEFDHLLKDDSNSIKTTLDIRNLTDEKDPETFLAIQPERSGRSVFLGVEYNF